MADRPTPSKKIKVEPKIGSSAAPKAEPVDEPSTVGESQRKRKIPKPAKDSKAIVIDAKKLLLNLNEECLLETLQRLTLTDLGAMAETCKHLKAVARKYFGIKHRTLALSSLVSKAGGKYTAKQVRQLLYNFGDLIKSLTVDTSLLDNPEHLTKLMSFIRKYCVSTVDELVFENHPGENIGDFIAVSWIGMELMTRNEPPGSYRTRSKTIYRQGQSDQISELIISPAE